MLEWATSKIGILMKWERTSSHKVHLITLSKIAQSPDTFYIYLQRASHVAGFEWVKCLHNVLLRDPSMRRFILRNEMLFQSRFKIPLILILHYSFKHVKQLYTNHVYWRLNHYAIVTRRASDFNIVICYTGFLWCIYIFSYYLIHYSEYHTLTGDTFAEIKREFCKLWPHPPIFILVKSFKWGIRGS